MTNLDKYKGDLKKLITKGGNLQNAMNYECYPNETTEALKRQKMSDKEQKDFIEKLPSFKGEYQQWYSESLTVIQLLLPTRLNDFRKIYERPKVRKELSHATYCIEDYMQGLGKYLSGKEIVGPSAAIDLFAQQLNILESVKCRFESSLFDIKQLVQADLFDSEIDGAKELFKNKFLRAAGVVAGVVLEKHLAQVCNNHNVLPGKKNPTINDFSEQLKNNNIIDVPQWRSVGYLADIRNICGHGKEADPTEDQVKTLIDGVGKLTKTLF